MNNVTVRLLITGAAAVATGAVGALAGFHFGKEHGRKQAWVEAEDEMEALEDRLKRLHKIGEYAEPRVSDVSGRITIAPGIEFHPAPSEPEVVDPDMLEKLRRHIETQGYAYNGEDSAVPIQGQGNIFEQYRNEDGDAGITPGMGSDYPYGISEADFEHDREDYTKISVSYYQVDGVVADAQDRVVDDIESTLGINNLTGFTEEITVIHIRNDKLEADFEVSLTEGSYRETVMGIEDGPVMERRGRKSRLSED